MALVGILKDVSSNFKSITNKPEQFLSVQNDKAEASKKVLKHLYDFLKQEESSNWQVADALPELITGGFDEEQIWQEIELQNEGLCNKIVKDVAVLLSKKSQLAFDADTKGDSESEDSGDYDSHDDEKSNADDDDDDDNEEEEEDYNFDDELSGSEREEDEEQKLQFTSEVDDDFFKLCEMENFCEKVEKEDERKSSSVLNLFGDDGQGSDEERELIRYNDFFVASKPKRDLKTGKHVSKKSVQFAEEAFSDEEGGLLQDVPDETPPVEEDEEKGPKSAFEARQARLKARIESLEDEAMKEKPWHLKGEVTSSGRPHNSLLEEYVEFDRAARPAPVFTEKTTLRLEDIIKQRVKDKSWDDVARKVKPVQDIREYRKKLVLDQEKSKISLAEIYEQEFVKQRDLANAVKDVPEDVEPAEHVQVKKMMKDLFMKLDALSNFHYTPKPVAPEIRIISNLPAITMEDVAPVATSEAALLAPEEVKNKLKGELMSREERTATDKKRERREKKLKQRLREQAKIKKEKLLSKMPLGLGNKYSKEKAQKTLDKLVKDKNVDRMVETQAKHLKSSSAFFNKLEDEVKSQVKRKATSGVMKRKKLINSISAKKIKL